MASLLECRDNYIFLSFSSCTPLFLIFGLKPHRNTSGSFRALRSSHLHLANSLAVQWGGVFGKMETDDCEIKFNHSGSSHGKTRAWTKAWIQLIFDWHERHPTPSGSRPTNWTELAPKKDPAETFWSPHSGADVWSEQKLHFTFRQHSQKG